MNPLARCTIVIISLLSFLSGNPSFGQKSNSTFYSEARGTVGKREKVNALAFNTPNRLAPFFASMKQRFGEPKSEGEFFVYKGYNEDWSSSKFVIRISTLTEVDPDNSKANTVFIFVETEQFRDLLKPNTISQKRINQYFLNLFNLTIKNGKRETFD